jgi:hypothetical protein
MRELEMGRFVLLAMGCVGVFVTVIQPIRKRRIWGAGRYIERKAEPLGFWGVICFMVALWIYLAVGFGFIPMFKL